MADPTGTVEPRPGDSNNMLLRKILLNLADLPGTFLTPAEGDLRYLKLTGGTLSGNLRIGSDVDPVFPTYSSRLLIATEASPNQITFATYGTAANSLNAVRGFAVGGTIAAPAATPNNSTLLNMAGSGHDGTNYVIGSKGAVIIGSAEVWSPTGNGTSIGFYTTRNGSTTVVQNARLSHTGVWEVGVSSKSLNAWGVGGALFLARNAVLTDLTSSGTVATAVSSTFQAPTFAASAATTFTDAANVYIGGDVAAGTNVTLTNSYGLWNVGKTRLDKNTGVGATPQPNITLIIGDVPLASGTNLFGAYGATTAPAGTTGTMGQFYSNPRTASGLALGTMSHFRASSSVLGGGGSTIAVQEGFTVTNTMTQGSVNYGFRGQLAVSGAARWNLFMDGTAPNRLDGETILFGATATPAGGSTTARLRFGSTAGFGIYFGSGVPTVSAAQGSLYLRSDGSTTATRLYVNTDGGTTWTNFVSAT